MNKKVTLTNILLKEQQTDKLLRVTEDKAHRNMLYEEYHL